MRASGQPKQVTGEHRATERTSHPMHHSFYCCRRFTRVCPDVLTPPSRSCDLLAAHSQAMVPPDETGAVASTVQLLSQSNRYWFTSPPAPLGDASASGVCACPPQRFHPHRPCRRRSMPHALSPPPTAALGRQRLDPATELVISTANTAAVPQERPCTPRSGPATPRHSQF